MSIYFRHDRECGGGCCAWGIVKLEGQGVLVQGGLNFTLSMNVMRKITLVVVDWSISREKKYLENIMFHPTRSSLHRTVYTLVIMSL